MGNYCLTPSSKYLVIFSTLSSLFASTRPQRTFPVRFPGRRVTGGSCEMPSAGCWKLNSSPLEEQETHSLATHPYVSL